MHQGQTRYKGFNQHLKDVFGGKVYRVSLNTHLSCPNIDGTKAVGGCYFCNDDYLLANSYHKQQEISTQLEEGIAYLKQRHRGTNHFLAYFQNGTNTHAKAETLRRFFELPLDHPEIKGMMISTRPDCLGDDVLDLLSEINERTYLWVELGLQSAQNHVLKKINRAHSVEEFSEACYKLAERKINNCAHMILGLPDESKEDMLAGADYLNKLPIQGVKIHNLFVTKYTVLEKWHREGKYTPLSLEEYTQLCVDYLERLRPDLVIHRINAHGPKDLTIAPDWSINKLATVNAIHDEIMRRDTHQGKLYTA
ncbi:MAG: TIGR01212 family radical SAM protein [Deltaproteobacteria bacterium]|nr:TIGR01212 family radical SAM protein [Deltaproteobacteria bacterium]